MNLSYFQTLSLPKAVKQLFNELEVPINGLQEEPTPIRELLADTFKENESFQLIHNAYFVGMVDDAAFKGGNSKSIDSIDKDYDGIIVFGVTLKERDNGLLPTRSQLAEIARAFNREFYYTPVVIVFKYDNHIAFANTERLKYKQSWREGEKAGRVSILRDINLTKTHSGHLRILNELKIPTSGSKKVDSFDKLYKYWQEVFSVSLLNKQFYQELANWYFWAIKHVTFPSKPTAEDAHLKGAKLDDLIQEHKATNVIRLLTRLLFVWFVKEKGLIPEDLFDLESLKRDILNDFSPYHQEGGIFEHESKESVYYRAILQNLFFATLNCPIQGDQYDNRSRQFRLSNTYGQHRGNDWMYRYEKYFKNPQAFIDLMNSKVPFLNGGLFECLDDKENNIYIDGFSDQMTKGEQLVVPDYLFFGTSEEVDLSAEYGIKNKSTKQAAVKGLINILKSYKFTITENTPIEEDVALDPELLGKVFENLLASYNPETKTTARKQTGSFYTPREIVNYMVDESLIAYLKNKIKDWQGLKEDEIDHKLHKLASFDLKIPFEDSPELKREIIDALSTCTILDPACGSGAFPMGILQKMVYMLQKLDPNNTVWKEIQLQKALAETEEAFSLDSKLEREEKLQEINEAFDERINNPDYARKLYLIENCIYGVDIQPIATQISKLRFFISLVVDQKQTKDAYSNFNIRPLPNLETRFVAANTLIGIDRPKANSQLGLYNTDKLRELENELKKVRHKLFSARTKSTKLKYRLEDERLRKAIANELIESGWPSRTAKQLALWDPYNQNLYAPFFDPEWMFDIEDGFDVLIGNPPYISYYSNTGAKLSQEERIYFVENYEQVQTKSDRINSMNLMTEKALKVLKKKGVVFFITNKTQAVLPSYKNFRNYIIRNSNILSLVDHLDPFEAIVDCVIIGLENYYNKNTDVRYFEGQVENFELLPSDNFNSNPQLEFSFSKNHNIISAIESHPLTLDKIITINRGVNIGGCFDEFLSTSKNTGYYPYLGGTKNIKPFSYKILLEDGFFKFDTSLESKLRKNGATLVLGNPDRYKLPHLFIPESGQRIMAAYCDEQVYGAYGLLVGTNPNNVELTKSACTILNSSLVTYYCIERGILRKGNKATPHVGVRGLNKIPIPNIDKSITNLLSDMCDLTTYSWSVSLNSFFSKISDIIVLNLYFKNKFNDLSIDIINYTISSINKISNGYRFSDLKPEDKSAFLFEIYSEWKMKNNPLNNCIETISKNSPDYLKPILES